MPEETLMGLQGGRDRWVSKEVSKDAHLDKFKGKIGTYSKDQDKQMYWLWMPLPSRIQLENYRTLHVGAALWKWFTIKLYISNNYSQTDRQRPAQHMVVLLFHPWLLRLPKRQVHCLSAPQRIMHSLSKSSQGEVFTLHLVQRVAVARIHCM